MVSRTNTSKTIRRRRGGQSDKERLTAEKVMTGEIGAHKRTSLDKINRERGQWEMVPGTGTSPYNPPKWRKKKKTTKKVVDSNVEADSSRAIGEAAADKVFNTQRARKARGDRAREKVFNTQRARKARGDRAREKVYSGHKPAQDPIPVTIEDLPETKAMKAFRKKQEEDRLERIKNESIMEDNLYDMSDPNFAAKAGGKVSKSKGGTVKKKYGGSPKKKKATNKKRQTKKTYGGHHGSKYVAKLYD